MPRSEPRKASARGRGVGSLAGLRATDAGDVGLKVLLPACSTWVGYDVWGRLVGEGTGLECSGGYAPPTHKFQNSLLSFVSPWAYAACLRGKRS